MWQVDFKRKCGRGANGELCLEVTLRLFLVDGGRRHYAFCPRNVLFLHELHTVFMQTKVWEKQVTRFLIYYKARKVEILVFWLASRG